MWTMISIYFCLVIPFVSSSTVTLSGGQYCSTDGGGDDAHVVLRSLRETSAHAVPGDIISINCVVDNPDYVINALIWSISSYGVLIANVNGDNAVDVDLDKPEFVSNCFDNTLRTTNATLTFPATLDLDGSVVECKGIQSSITSECTLSIKSKLIYTKLLKYSVIIVARN